MRDSGPDDPRRARAGRATAAELRTYLTVASLLLADAAIISVIGYLSLPPDAHLAVHLRARGPDRYAGRTFTVLAAPVALLGLLAIGAGAVGSAAQRNRRRPEHGRRVQSGHRLWVRVLTAWHQRIASTT
jgi:hypothetical protein